MIRVYLTNQLLMLILYENSDTLPPVAFTSVEPPAEHREAEASGRQTTRRRGTRQAQSVGQASARRGGRAGRTRMTRNHVYPKGYRGFESLPLRHKNTA